MYFNSKNFKQSNFQYFSSIILKVYYKAYFSYPGPWVNVHFKQFPWCELFHDNFFQIETLALIFQLKLTRTFNFLFKLYSPNGRSIWYYPASPWTFVYNSDWQCLFNVCVWYCWWTNISWWKRWLLIRDSVPGLSSVNCFYFWILIYDSKYLWY